MYSLTLSHVLLVSYVYCTAHAIYLFWRTVWYMYCVVLLKSLFMFHVSALQDRCTYTWTNVHTAYMCTCTVCTITSVYICTAIGRRYEMSCSVKGLLLLQQSGQMARCTQYLDHRYTQKLQVQEIYSVYYCTVCVYSACSLCTCIKAVFGFSFSGKCFILILCYLFTSPMWSCTFMCTVRCGY